MKIRKYRYALLMRPPQLGALPIDGLLITSCEPVDTPSGHHSWGWAEYNRMLSPEEIVHYELEYIGTQSVVI